MNCGKERLRQARHERVLEVVICTFNNCESLDRALSALGAQDARGEVWSATVVDNNCTDATADVVAAHIRSGRIPALRRIHAREQGQAFARKVGVEQSTAEWIAFVDDDCMLATDWVSSALQFVATASSCGVWGGRNEVHFGASPSALVEANRRVYAAQDFGVAPRVVPGACIVGAGMVVRREALLESRWLERARLAGRAGRSVASGDDTEMALRIVGQGWDAWYNPKCTLEHHIAARRVTDDYLGRLCRGMGQAGPYLHGLQWRYGWGAWVLGIPGYLAKLGATAVRAYVNERRGVAPPGSAKLRIENLRGTFSGLVDVLAQDRAAVRSWIGAGTRHRFSRR